MNSPNPLSSVPTISSSLCLCSACDAVPTLKTPSNSHSWWKVILNCVTDLYRTGTASQACCLISIEVRLKLFYVEGGEEACIWQRNKKLMLRGKTAPPPELQPKDVHKAISLHAWSHSIVKACQTSSIFWCIFEQDTDVQLPMFLSDCFDRWSLGAFAKICTPALWQTTGVYATCQIHVLS